MKKSVLSLLMACLMVVSTFIVSKPTVSVYALGDGSEQLQAGYVFPFDLKLGTTKSGQFEMKAIARRTGELVEVNPEATLEGSWGMDYYEHKVTSATGSGVHCNVTVGGIFEIRSTADYAGAIVFTAPAYGLYSFDVDMKRQTNATPLNHFVKKVGEDDNLALAVTGTGYSATVELVGEVVLEKDEQLVIGINETPASQNDYSRLGHNRTGVNGIKITYVSDNKNIDEEVTEKTGMAFTQTVKYQTSKILEEQPKTFEAWVKIPVGTTSSDKQRIMSNYYDGSHASYGVDLVNSTNPALWISPSWDKDTRVIFDEVDLRTGEWTHIAITYTSDTAYCYVNGVLAQTKSQAIPELQMNNDVNGKFCIGSDYIYDNNRYFKAGLIHSVTLFNDVRTADEIKADYEGIKNASSDLLAHYNLSGEGIEALRDYSSNKNHLNTVKVSDGSIIDSYVKRLKLGQSFTADDYYAVVKPFAHKPLTLEATVYFPEDTVATLRGGKIMGSYGDGTKASLSIEIMTNGNPRLYFYDNALNMYDFLFTSVNVYNGKATHIAFTLTSEGVNLYVDGALAESKANTKAAEAMLNTDFSGSQSLVFGGDNRSGNEHYFRGQILDLAFYSDVRTETEIKADMLEYGTDGLILGYESPYSEATVFSYKDISANGYDLKLISDWLESNEVSDYSYSFVIVGDTQNMNYYYPEAFGGIFDYIADNIENKNVQMVINLGDVTETSSNAEWERVQAAFGALDGKVPYTNVRGNHDSIDKYNSVFGTTAYMGQLTGSYAGKPDNTYRAFSVGDVDYLIVALDYGPSDEVIEWAAGVIESYPHHNVIVVTHAYLYRDGTTHDANDPWAPTVDGGGFNNGDDLWEKLIKKHENIVMVIGGHTSHDKVLTVKTEGENGNVVTQLLVDPQELDRQIDGGTGMITTLYFSKDGKKVQLETYSTVKNLYYLEDNQYDFEVNTVNPDHVGGEATCQKGAVCEICGEEYTAKSDKHADENGTWTNGNGTHSFNRTCCDETDIATENCTYGSDNICDKCGYDCTVKVETNDLNNAINNIVNGTSNNVTVVGPTGTMADDYVVEKIEGVAYEYKYFNIAFDDEDNFFLRHHIVCEGALTVTVNGTPVELKSESANVYYFDTYYEAGQFHVGKDIVINGDSYNVSLYSYIKLALEGEIADLDASEETFLRALYDLNEALR